MVMMKFFMDHKILEIKIYFKRVKFWPAHFSSWQNFILQISKNWWWWMLSKRNKKEETFVTRLWSKSFKFILHPNFAADFPPLYPSVNREKSRKPASDWIYCNILDSLFLWILFYLLYQMGTLSISDLISKIRYWIWVMYAYLRKKHNHACQYLFYTVRFCCYFAKSNALISSNLIGWTQNGVTLTFPNEWAINKQYSHIYFKWRTKHILYESVYTIWFNSIQPVSPDILF